MIDCPGVVNDAGNDASDRILKSVLRAEKIEEPLEHIPRILEKVKKEYLQKIYKISEWTDHEDFVGQLATSYGKLLKVCIIF